MARAAKIDPRTVLTERLRAEACDSRPAFYEVLHARICDTVWQCGNTGWRAATGSRRRQRLRRSLRLAGVAAAAAALLAAVLLGPSRQPARPVVVVKAPSPSAPSPASPALSTEPAGSESGFELVTDLADRATEHFDSLFDAADQWAYLDHDARLTLELLSERLPISLVPSSSEPLDPAEFSSGL